MDTICWTLYVLYETIYMFLFPFIYLQVCTCLLLWQYCAISHSHANKDHLNWIERARDRERDIRKCQMHQLLMDRGWQQLLTLGGKSRLLSSTVETVNSQDRVSTDTCIENTTLLSASLAALKKTLHTHIQLLYCQDMPTLSIISSYWPPVGVWGHYTLGHLFFSPFAAELAAPKRRRYLLIIRCSSFYWRAP